MGTPKSIRNAQTTTKTAFSKDVGLYSLESSPTPTTPAAESIPDTDADVDDPKKNSKICNPLSPPPTAPAAKVYNCIPLLLCDVHDAIVCGKRFKVFDDVLFQKCIVYAHIMSRCRITKYYYIYNIIDGSDQSTLRILRRERERRKGHRLQIEVNTVYSMPNLPPSTRLTADCLSRLLKHAAAQLDHSQLSIGSSVLICGTPYRFKDNPGLSACSVHVDDGIVRDLEIEFKDFLIDWYERSRKIKAIAQPQTPKVSNEAN